MDILDELTTQYEHPEAAALKKEVQAAIATLTQPAVNEARHHVGPPPPDKGRRNRSASHVESAPTISKGNITVIAVTAAILLAVFGSIIVIALLG